MHLTAIIDWYSRMIVGWNHSDTLDTFSARSIRTLQRLSAARRAALRPAPPAELPL